MVFHAHFLNGIIFCKFPENNKKMESWPNAGQIEFRNLYLYYTKNDPPAIRDLCLVIKPGNKVLFKFFLRKNAQTVFAQVGIIGRTGAGKTSLIGALFRLAKLEGSVIIDDVDTSNISLQKLRSKISIIPQEPVLFSGTIRRNLDPFMVN